MPTHPSILLLVAVAACSAGTGQHSPDSNQAIPAQAQPEQLSPQVARTTDDSLFFGVSNTEDGQRAWLVRLGKAGTGKLYLPPGSLRIAYLKDSLGNVTFETERGLGDVVYAYTGQHTPEGIRGVIQRRWTNGVPARPVETFPLDLRAIRLPVLDTAQLSGSFSNSLYSAESGDLTGTEIVFISDSAQLLGVYVSHEGGSVAYAAREVKVAGDTVRFRLFTRDGVEEYRAVFKDDQIALYSAGGNAVSDSPQILPRAKRTRQLLGS